MASREEGDDVTTPSSVVTAGSVSGQLPTTVAFAVNYPGYPSSTSRAIQTLGGLPQIAKARSDPTTTNLELRFRPEDPYSHPAIGRPRDFSGLLLRISRTRPGPDSSAERLSADVVARVNQAFDFEGMVDYQHVIPVHAAAATRKRKLEQVSDETDLEKDGDLNKNQEDVMMLVPPFFSLKDKRTNLVLNSPANLFSKNMQRGVVEHCWEMDLEPCLAISFSIDRIPITVDWESNIPRDTQEWELQLVVSKLFEERPIWPRWSLYERLLDDGLDITGHLLKRLLFRTGYYFSNGPYGKFWIRKGYDPRKDPESRIYQKVDFRLPPSLRYHTNVNKKTGSKQTLKEICQFQVTPMKNFTLQFFELIDDFIQEEIRKPTDQTICTHSTGWFSRQRLKTLTLHVKMKFLSLFPEGIADPLLRIVSELLKRSKKQEVLRSCSQLGKENQIINRDSDIPGEVECAESNVPEDEVEGQGDKCEIENDEDDEEEEDLDGYESSPVAGEDGSLSPQASSYQIEGSIPNNYLQELLRSFPFGSSDGAGSKGKGIEDADLSSKGIDDVDLSDDEFQIYEQDSDEDYDD